MGKLRLELDALAVETFDTSPARDGRGTVAGHNTYVTVGADCGSACGVCSVQQSECLCGGNTQYGACTYGQASCGGTCDTNCITCASCEGTCPQVGCPTGYTCDGSTCADTCRISCHGTCGCTQEVTCPCI